MENTLIDGRYQLLAAIGAGGEARVFHAHDMVEGNDVAVRLPLRPGHLAAAAGPPCAFHLGWVQLLGWGADPQYGPYQILELLEGQTLGQLIEASGPLDATSWRAFVDQSLAAVEALHAVDWSHGDLNAGNFVLTASGWKMLELPFLRFDPPEGRSAAFGSIHTLSPEQIDGKRPDVRSDIYSIGCLYYYAASGLYPHPGSTNMEVAIHCLRFPPEPLDDKAPGLPAAWREGVMKLLETKADERPSSIAAAHQLLGVEVA